MTSHQQETSFLGLKRRQICSAFFLVALATSAGTSAQPLVDPRPLLSQFIQAAKLHAQSRLWAKDVLRTVKRSTHPLYAPASQITAANDSELHVLLAETFKTLTEEEAGELLAVLATPSGHWIVDATLWVREDVFGKSADSNRSPSAAQGNPPRTLSNTEIDAIKALADTSAWQALRRAGNASLLGTELMIAFDWPQFVDMVKQNS